MALGLDDSEVSPAEQRGAGDSGSPGDGLSAVLGWWQQPHSLQGYRVVICLVTHPPLFSHPIESIQFLHEVNTVRGIREGGRGERGEERNREREEGVGEGAEGGERGENLEHVSK